MGGTCQPAGVDGVDRIGALATAGILVLGVAAATGLGEGGDGTGSQAEPQAEPLGHAEDLVDAWERSRTATYHATGTFRRTGPGGAELSVDVELAQRPPDRLHRQFGEVTGRRGDRPLQCPAPIGEEPLACRLGPPDGGFQEAVAEEVAAFRRLVTGPEPLYEVAPGREGCWRMARTRPDPRGGFGLEAAICFDAATGAIRSVTVDHGEVDERTAYDRIDPEVTDADLEP